MKQQINALSSKIEKLVKQRAFVYLENSSKKTKIVSNAFGTSLPKNPVEGEIFFLIESNNG